MKYLKNQNIQHRDLKEENILLHNNEIKIADLGFSKIKEDLYEPS